MDHYGSMGFRQNVEGDLLVSIGFHRNVAQSPPVWGWEGWGGWRTQYTMVIK